MRPEDTHGVRSLLMDSFFIDEPLAACLQLGQPREFADVIIADALRDRCSFVVYDQQSNDVVGVSLNEIRRRNDNPPPIDESNEKLHFILHLLESMHQPVNLFDELETDSLLHIFIINVKKSLRGHRLGSRMISASVQHAQNLHIKGVYAEATNLHSFRCFQQEQFQVYHCIQYIDYDPVRLAALTGEHQKQCQLVARLT